MIPKLPDDLRDFVLSFLECCAQTACAKVWRRLGIRPRCKIMPWLPHQCVAPFPQMFVRMMHAVVTREPGHNDLTFTTERERLCFEHWAVAFRLRGHLDNYIRMGTRLWKPLPRWERDPFVPTQAVSEY